MSYDVTFTLKSLDTILQRSTDDFSWLDPTQFAPVLDWGVARVTSASAVIFIHADDQADERRIILHGLGSGQSLDRLPTVAWRQALQRIYRVALAARSARLRLPLDWSEYHIANLLAFFACHKSHGSYRWLAQVGPFGTADVVFWGITDASDRTPLQEFSPSKIQYDLAVSHWDASVAKAKDIFARLPRPSPYIAMDGAIDLASATYGAVTGGSTFSGWLHRLTSEQDRFLNHATDTPVKLRGPAGSGKTLALELKALKELYSSHQANEPCRILFLTHSWAMAENVDHALHRLDEKGLADNIDTFPLVELAKLLLPADHTSDGLSLLGNDSLSGRRLLLDRIGDTLVQLRRGDWLVYQSSCSSEFRARVEAPPTSPESNALVWDLMHEFSSVLAASGILPGITAEKRYLALKRADWMMSLAMNGEKQFVLRVYSEYVKSLRAERLFSIDQLINDSLSYLETFAWDYVRQQRGYDLILVDEFHLFADQERQILNYLSRDPDHFPCVLMALDPRQSPSELYTDFPVANVSTAQSKEAEMTLNKADAVDLRTIHRFSPQILEFVKFIHQSFPTLELGADWFVDTRALNSSATDGALPRLYQYADEDQEIAGATERAIERQNAAAAGRTAVVLLDDTRLRDYKAEFLKRGIPVLMIRSRDDIDALRFSKRSVVLGLAEHMLGLQFDDVVVTGFPTMTLPQHVSDPQLRRLLSALYVAVTRASREVEVHFLAGTGEGDLASLLEKAIRADVVESW